MLTRPQITDESIIACLRDGFGLRIIQVTFLSIGADVNSAAFRVTVDNGTPYFLKLRSGYFNPVAVEVPTFLYAQGIRTVMAPLPTIDNQLWASAGGFSCLLYRYFEGTNGFEAILSKMQWHDLGESLRAVHGAPLPAGLASRLPREDYEPRLRNVVRAFDRHVRQTIFDDPIAARFADLWTARRNEIQCIVDRAEGLAQTLRNREVGLVLCHSDLHAGNVLLGADDELAIVDWDEPILAPKERDLMFVGGGVGGVWNQPQEADWFYEGYGHAMVDPVALYYYRYERIVADFAAYADQILGLQGSAEDRELGLRQVMSQFLPGDVIEIAHRSYPFTV
jgi:spectinomycin phosphotransferase